MKKKMITALLASAMVLSLVAVEAEQTATVAGIHPPAEAVLLPHPTVIS